MISGLTLLFSLSLCFPIVVLCELKSRQTKEDVKSGGLSSSSEEFSSPIPNQQNFSPPFHNGSRRQYSNSPLSNSGGSRLRAADPMGNIFILPRQLDVGLCQCCRNIYGAKDDHHHHHHVSHCWCMPYISANVDIQQSILMFLQQKVSKI